MLSPFLEESLNSLFQKARSEGAEFIATEDLLRALLGDTRCRELLVDLGANAEGLESKLDAIIESRIPVESARPKDVQPTLGFQRTLQRASFHVQSSRKKDVGHMDILVALFSERDSAAVRLLSEQGITLVDVAGKLGMRDSYDFDKNVVGNAVQSKWYRSSAAAFTSPSGTPIDRRFDNLEKKLDTAIGEIRKVSEDLKQLMKRPPSNS
jgi:ATP-dependent Clp protease ATP-binding subunit ClpA